MSQFHNILRKRHAELGVSQAEIARRLGIEVRRYGQYATGTREPEYDLLVRICQMLGITPNQALGVDPLASEMSLPDTYGDDLMTILSQLQGGGQVEAELRDRLLRNIAESLIRQAQMLKQATDSQLPVPLESAPANRDVPSTTRRKAKPRKAGD